MVTVPIPLYFAHFLKYWYANQIMKVRWGCGTSQEFLVSNGVRQGEILSFYLFSLYMDDLSDRLNAVQCGCFVGNKRNNHLMYADALCCFAPSFDGLQDLVNACSKYAESHCIVFVLVNLRV